MPCPQKLHKRWCMKGEGFRTAPGWKPAPVHPVIPLNCLVMSRERDTICPAEGDFHAPRQRLMLRDMVQAPQKRQPEVQGSQQRMWVLDSHLQVEGKGPSCSCELSREQKQNPLTQWPSKLPTSSVEVGMSGTGVHLQEI